MKSQSAVIALSALAQESRLAVYRLLVRRGPEGYTPGDIGARLDIPAPTLSFHLKTLTAAGLLEVRRDGRHLHYSVDTGQMNRIVEFLTEHCCSLATDGSAHPCRPVRPA